ncbi:MAG TPA: hypothetical protein PLE33_08940 [Candidatus Cloacimonas sp.]|nr:hypothetical protein [Candidatus Cloacimonas sp.]HPS61366.1 hypothetical protein [Candidatus Cloacimonas sp.]
MIKTNIDMSLGDVIDRLTILTRKIFFGEVQAHKEHTALSEGLSKLDIKLTGELLNAIIWITQMNFEVWNRENGFRRGEEMTAEDVKKMMIEVRDMNKRRIEYRNEINRITGTGFKEFKVNHRSQ